ncbi:MAG: HlyD family efflux transporter periplasmic adaptor subunit [Bacteroidales bacterium]
MIKRLFLLFNLMILTGLISCNDSQPEDAEQEQMPVVSVKTVKVMQGDIESNIILNGKTVYLKKNAIVSPINGYIVKVNVKFGDIVNKNDVLFEIQTKENKALETGNSGTVKVLASSEGMISELNINGTGIYAVEGGPLCSIIENKDLLVQVNMPFEYNSLVKPGTECTIFLTDNTSVKGSIYQVLPMVNEESQTQNVLIKAITNRPLPENLNLTVQFINSRHIKSSLIPKEAVLTNETQSEFWVMKIEDDSLAVRIPIRKGIENDSLIEVFSPDLKMNDLVISEGAYGLPDSSKVNVLK